ncbi:MAG: TrkH family potassium uptake protein [Actinobacteria bacterium]|nr:TrkH family potassium uptake protein [Actinomycetota bacterium]
MFIRPDRDDMRIIGFYVGKVILGLGLVMFLPAAMAFVLGEWNALTAFVIGGSVAVTVGRLSEAVFFTRESLDWSHGMATVALSWLLGPLLVALPLYLSGHFDSYLDALFDAMSGLTSTGLTVLQDIDHLARSMNLFRHLTQFVGGQGIIIVVLTLFAAGSAQVGTLYVGEGRDERIMPNVIRTARFIFIVAFAFMLVGTAALTIANTVAGLAFPTALFHAINLFMAAFDTGGFATQSTSVGYYHSALVEGVLMVVMFAGTLSFGLHYQLWRGQSSELLRNIETRALALTLLVLTGLTFLGLVRSGAFNDADPLFRKGFFTIVSAQTNTGLTVNTSRLFVTDWGVLAPAAIVGAMALGGMASSTSGGIKAIRVGLVTKGLLRDIRRVLMPENALVIETYHSNRRRILTDSVVKSAATVLLLYLLSYLGGAMVALFYGRWELTETLFESVSAASNAGMSVGITDPAMPQLLQVIYIAQMWLGRLEFMAVFAFVGFVVAALRGRT